MLDTATMALQQRHVELLQSALHSIYRTCAAKPWHILEQLHDNVALGLFRLLRDAAYLLRPPRFRILQCGPAYTCGALGKKGQAPH